VRTLGVSGRKLDLRISGRASRAGRARGRACHRGRSRRTGRGIPEPWRHAFSTGASVSGYDIVCCLVGMNLQSCKDRRGLGVCLLVREGRGWRLEVKGWNSGGSPGYRIKTWYVCIRRISESSEHGERSKHREDTVHITHIHMSPCSHKPCAALQHTPKQSVIPRQRRVLNDPLANLAKSVAVTRPAPREICLQCGRASSPRAAPFQLSPGGVWWDDGTLKPGHADSCSAVTHGWLHDERRPICQRCLTHPTPRHARLHLFRSIVSGNG